MSPMTASHREEFILALYLWLDALVEGYPARTHRDQLDRIARSTTDHILPDLHRLLKHKEYKVRSILEQVAWARQMTDKVNRMSEELRVSIFKLNTQADRMELELHTEQREHEITRNKLSAEVTNRGNAIELAVAAKTNELSAKLTAKTNAYRNLEVGCRNRVRDLQIAECALRILQTRYDSLSEDCATLRHQRDTASSTSEELLSKYKALYESSKHSEEMVRALVDDGKKGIVTQQLQSRESCIVLSPATIETICNGVKHNISALVKEKQDLQHDATSSRQREVLLSDDIRGLQQANTFLSHRLQNLEFIQTTRSNDVYQLEKGLHSKDKQVQTLVLEQKAHLENNAKLEEKL